ncbi:MAG: sigma-54-dependent Fis family transcriptional regulator [Deltaproteobacteria bacterium]|nr:sigma-54-dependent Fis family transcriptional regulator [Deltaproteobacteria bacterium]
MPANFRLHHQDGKAAPETEQFFLRIFDSFADPLAIYDRDYRILKVNRALLNFYQRTAKQLAGKHCYEVFHNRSSVCKDCHVQKVFLLGKPQRREMLVSLPDGSQRHFEVHAYPVKDASGATVQAIEHGRDISQRKSLEIELKTSEEKYRTIVELAREGIFIVDAEDNLTFANSFLARMLGYDGVEDIIGQPVFDFITADGVALGKAQLERRRLGFSDSYELPLCRQDGSSLISLVAAAPFTVNGTFLGSIGIATDITHLKQVERELRSAKEFREKIINGITDNLVVIDPRTYRIVQANDSFLGRVGQDSHAILGKTCYEVMLHRNSPCKEEGIHCPVLQAAREKLTAFGDRVYPDAQGQERILQISAYPLLDNQGDVDLVVRLERDVTDKRKMEEALTFRSRELQKTQHQLETLFEISRQMNAKDFLSELVEALITKTGEIFPESEPLLLILDADRSHFLHLATGLDHMVEQPGMVADFVRYLGKIQDPQIFTGANGPHTPAFLKIISEIYPSWFGLPILVQRQCIGLFLLGSRKPTDYPKGDLHFLQALLDQTAGHVRSLVLHEAEINQLRHHQATKASHGGLIGQSKKMQEVYELIDLVSASDATVLITGENGTGKELAAQAIHQRSHRSKGPFVVANCSAYSPTLLESELFGHEKGSFTGAIRQKKGRIERAHGGTLFLDEIGDISPATQVLLLRFLQDHYFERVGGERAIEANVRVLAATNQDLQKAVETGNFRDDLYYRLNVIAIHMPPLRERKDDIPLLCWHFLSKCNLKEKKNIQKISANAMQALMDYDWPGNVRQLENAINHAVIITQGETIRRRHLPRFLKEGLEIPHSSSLAENERRLILRVLQEANWNKHEAARRLQLTRSTLYSKIRRYSLEKAKLSS